MNAIPAGGSATSIAHAMSVAEVAAREAGAFLQAQFLGSFDVIAKGDAGDVVTDIDLQSERLIVARLRAAFPDFAIQSEEVGLDGDSDLKWVVDPLDGTNNYVLGVPLYGVSLALYDGSDPLGGVIYQPLVDRLWSFSRGRGVRRNGVPVHCTPVAEPQRVTVSLLLGYSVSAASRRLFAALHQTLSGGFKRVLTTWAPTIDWPLFCDGAVGAVIVVDANSEDLLAGLPMAMEAGASLHQLNGDPATPSVPFTGFVCHPDSISLLTEMLDAG